MELVQRSDRGKVAGKVRKLDSGAIVVDARLTRTGIFDYQNPDGSVRRELRPEAEVFDATSLETLSGLPVTQGHPGMVDVNTWRNVAVGHAGDAARRDGEFVLSKIWIQDGETVAEVEAKTLVEVSMGYTCQLEMTPGQTEDGQKYDAIQRNIRYNHVGLGPRNWGRAGTEVRLLTDSKGLPILETNMDPKELERLIKAAADEKARADAAEAKVKDLEAKVNAATARADAAEGKADGLAKQLEGETARFDARLGLVQGACSVLGKEYKADGKDDAQIMGEVIAKLDPTVKTDGKSADYLRGLFDVLLANHGKAAVSHARETVDGAGGTVVSSIESARDRMLKRNAEAKK